MSCLHVFFRFFFSASEKSSALGEELKTMFVSYSENVLRDNKNAKEELEAKASAIEEVISLILLPFDFMFFIIFYMHYYIILFIIS